MSFQPVLPLGGYGGWRFLNRTLETQQAQFAKSPMVQRDAAYFREKIGQVESAADLVADRRLLRVALGAFGLDDALPNRFFIRKVLEEGTQAPDAFANRLADKRYAALSRAFGFGDSETPLTGTAGFADRILKSHETRQFEVAVGNQDQNMRLALNLRRELSELASGDQSERAKWFTVMGTPPLRQVFEAAFNLPRSFGALDLDRQLGILQERTRRSFGDGSISQFSDPDKIDALARQFILRSEIQAGMMGGAARGSAALQLLQTAAQRGPLLR
ncbi:DUF1217 domain-containing protein [Rhodobaculum claviforme]|uniref:Flagellar protein n=1 Tax=Rhodobaculum claviforme TaxID=1549854 RepID=A0A934WJA2_9RHOB|nr:DUF1217 domain-containing protein [Rhodobaculum claviforme]MBK5927644.1 hypothetical protein [Rhodobaculum claviforme]